MQEEQAERIVATLRERRVMAHVYSTGVYNFGIRIVIPDGREAIWDADGAAGLEATVLRDELVGRQQQRIRDALRREHELPPRWRRAAQTSSAALTLGPAELEELGERFEALIDEFRGSEDRRGARSVIVSFGAVAEP